MRILYVINGFDPGGAEHGLLTLVENKMFDGHELKVLALCLGQGALTERIRQAVGADNVEVVSDSSRLTLKNCGQSILTLCRENHRWKPQVVVLSMKQANLIGRLVQFLFPSSRCVSFEHIARYRASKAQWVYGWVLWLLSARVDEIWADCHETHRATRRYFLPRPRTRATVPLFSVDPQVSPKKHYERSETFRIVGAGRLVDRKRFQAVIGAVDLLNREGIPTTLDIVGDGPDRNRLARLIADSGLEPRVRLLGYRKRWFENAAEYDAFVNASDTEGFCIVVAEAMAMGLPVVASDVGGVRDYGIHGHNMLKLPDLSPESIASQLAILCRNTELRTLLGSGGRAQMLNLYDRAAVVRRCREIAAW